MSPNRGFRRSAANTVRRLGSIAFAVCAASASVGAQEMHIASITGVVTDSTGAVLPRVALTLSGPTPLGGSRRTTTDEQGIYHFAILTAGIYELSAELRGFKTVRRQAIQPAVGTTIRVDFQLEVAPVAETATASAGLPVVDATTAASSVRLDDDLLRHLPTVRQQPESINLIPGVEENVAFGGTQYSNALLIDGVGVSETKLGSGFHTLLFNYNWIQEVQPVALGAGAEYGEFTGLVANSIIRSGGNRMSGLGEHWMSHPRWMWSNTSSLPPEREYQFRFTQPLMFRDSSAQLGGPLIRDRFWFFTGFQYLRREERLAGVGDAVNRQRDRKTILKLTAAASARARLEGFYERDWSRTDGAIIGDLGPAETLASQRSPATSWNARLTWQRSERTLLELRHTGYRSQYSLDPMAPNTRSGAPPHLDVFTGRASGNAPYYLRYVGRPLSAAATVTLHPDRVLGGKHQLKFGVEHQRTTAIDEFGYPGGRWYLDDDGQPYLVVLFDGSADRTTSRRTTAYAQNTWTVHDRLTIEPGLRVGVNRGSVPERGTVFATNPVAARLGFAWALTQDQKTVVRLHYGRYHDPLLSGQFQFMDSLGEKNPYITAVVLPSGRLAELDRFEGSKNFAIDDRLAHSHVDQYLVGFERELPASVSLQVQYVRRNFRNFMAFVDTGSVYAEVPARDPGPDGKIGTADDGGIFTVFNKTNPGHEFRLLTNPPHAYRQYDAVQIIGRRRYVRTWQLLAAYTWSRTEGNVDQRLGSNAGLHDAGYTGVFTNPNRQINAAGRTSFDFPHQLKAQGTYRVPVWGGFNFSAVYRYHSGLAWGRRAQVLWLWQGSEQVRLEPRGTRRLPALSNLDVRAEKTFQMGPLGASLGIFIDVFNATNQGAPNSRYPFAVFDLSGPNFGEPGSWIEPRTIRGGARFTF